MAVASVGMEGHERIFSLIVLTVTNSVIAHGVSAAPLAKLYAKMAT
jgi:hypothetical protein